MSRIVVHTSEPSSGAARYVSEFVAGLAAHTNDVILFCPPAFDFIREVRSRGVDVVFSARRNVEPAGTLARLTRNVKHTIGSAIKQAKATRRGDIVHFQFPLYFPAGFAFFAVARWKGCSIVLTAHDPIPHKWLLPARLRFLEWNMVRLGYHLSDRIVVHNDAGKQVITGKFSQSPDKIAVIPHGPLRLTETIGAAPSEGLRLLVFGGIRENKGVHLAIEAVQSLNAGSIPVELTIAGAAANAREESYWETCKRLIERKPRGIRVIDRYIENDEIGPLMQAHHAMLLPYSDYTSESGVAALALANGRAIIATRAGGLGPLLSTEVACGIPIERDTADAVEAAIVRAMELGPERLKEMGEAGSALMDSGRSWTEIGCRTLAVYNMIRAARRSVASYRPDSVELEP